ncbi:MAG: hypothetical protein K0R10_1149 [Alphaproteobacteria bacterium]|jgi:hypothetical protein|nr:hypothetical protein [Alphaproteobacteria bacterium]
MNAEHKRLLRLIQARKGQPDFFIAEAAPAQLQPLLSQVDGLFAQNAITPAHIDLAKVGGVANMMDKLESLAQGGVDVVHLVNAGDWLRAREPFNDGTAQRVDILNIQRENLFRIPVKTMMWLDATDIGMLASTALDLWSWRSGVYDLSTPAAPFAPNAPAAAPAGPK